MRGVQAHHKTTKTGERRTYWYWRATGDSISQDPDTPAGRAEVEALLERLRNPPPDVPCCLCGRSCDGSMMRYDKRYDRVPKMLQHESIPRSEDGRLLLCHVCQRQVYFKGGFLKLLVDALDYASRHSPRRRAA